MKRRIVAVVLSLALCMGGTLEAGAAALGTPEVQAVVETESGSAGDSFSDEAEQQPQPDETPGESTGIEVMPEITETPDVTETPDSTVTPEVTETPDITEIPEITETPDADQADDDGEDDDVPAVVRDEVVDPLHHIAERYTEDVQNIHVSVHSAPPVVRDGYFYRRTRRPQFSTSQEAIIIAFPLSLPSPGEVARRSRDGEVDSL